jgi:hypothetical protein
VERRARVVSERTDNACFTVVIGCAEAAVKRRQTKQIIAVTAAIALDIAKNLPAYGNLQNWPIIKLSSGIINNIIFRLPAIPVFRA